MKLISLATPELEESDPVAPPSADSATDSEAADAATISGCWVCPRIGWILGTCAKLSAVNCTFAVGLGPFMFCPVPAKSHSVQQSTWRSRKRARGLLLLQQALLSEQVQEWHPPHGQHHQLMLHSGLLVSSPHSKTTTNTGMSSMPLWCEVSPGYFTSQWHWTHIGTRSCFGMPAQALRTPVSAASRDTWAPAAAPPTQAAAATLLSPAVATEASAVAAMTPTAFVPLDMQSKPFWPSPCARWTTPRTWATPGQT